MTYVVHVFDHPAPSSLHEANELHARLSSAQAAPNPKFAQLARDLHKHFGGGRPSKALTELIGDGTTDGSAVYSLEAFHSDPSAIVSFALPLGLCVYDDQAARCYLPGGFVLTDSGRFQLPPIQNLLAPVVSDRLVPGSQAWTLRQLLDGLQGGLGELGFKGHIWECFVCFSRVTPAGLQIIKLQVRNDIQVTPVIELEPVMPHALYRVVRPGRTISCFAPVAAAIRQFSYNPNEPVIPGKWAWIELARAANQMIQPLLSYFLDEVMPILDACRDVPGILRMERERSHLPSSISAGRDILALAHWTGEDVQQYAEEMMVRDAVNTQSPDIIRAAAKEFAQLSEWKGQWKPVSAPCRVRSLQDYVTEDQAKQARLLTLKAKAKAHGFSCRETQYMQFRFERQTGEIQQGFTLDHSEPGILGELTFDWYSPALWQHWEALVAPWVLPHPKRMYVWTEFDMRVIGVDTNDLSDTPKFREYWPDYLRDLESGVDAVMARVFEPAKTLKGMATLLRDPHERPKRGPLSVIASGFEVWACQLLLAGAFNPTWLQAHGPEVMKQVKPRPGQTGYFVEVEQALTKVAREALAIARKTRPNPFVSD